MRAEPGHHGGKGPIRGQSRCPGSFDAGGQRVDRVLGARSSAFASSRICHGFILRTAEGVSQTFDHDYEAAILFLTISVRNGDKAMNDPKLRELYGSYTETIPAEHALFVSRMALARATGLPRETVRRKVAKLIARGWVEEHPEGLRARPDLNRDPRYIATLEPQAQNLRRLFAMLVQSGAELRRQWRGAAAVGGVFLRQRRAGGKTAVHSAAAAKQPSCPRQRVRSRRRRLAQGSNRIETDTADRPGS